MPETRGRTSAPTWGPTRLLRRALLWAAVAIIAACGARSDDAIDRDVFIDTYVDLRVAALETDSQRVSTPDRDSILTAHGVVAEDLDHFTNVHAEDLDFMRDLWNDVELRMDRTPSEQQQTSATLR